MNQETKRIVDTTTSECCSRQYDVNVQVYSRKLCSYDGSLGLTTPIVYIMFCMYQDNTVMFMSTVGKSFSIW